MKLSELSVRRPVLISMTYLLLLLVSLLFLKDLDIALYPVRFQNRYIVFLKGKVHIPQDHLLIIVGCQLYIRTDRTNLFIPVVHKYR